MDKHLSKYKYEDEIRKIFKDLDIDNHFINPLLKSAELKGIKDPRTLLKVYISEEMLMGWLGISFFLFNTYRYWKWPYWVYKQCDPNDKGFISPQGGLSGSNNTYSDVTGIGLPTYEHECVVGPWGSITPGGTSQKEHFLPQEYSYCLDFWVYFEEKKELVSIGEKGDIKQELLYNYLPVIKTTWKYRKITLTIESFINVIGDIEVCFNRVVVINNGDNDLKGTFFATIRPFGPIRFSPISKLKYDSKLDSFIVQDNLSVVLDEKPDSFSVSNLENNDVCEDAEDGFLNGSIESIDDLGYCTGASGYNFKIGPNRNKKYIMKMIPRPVKPSIELVKKLRKEEFSKNLDSIVELWEEIFSKSLKINTPDKKLNNLFKTCIVNLCMNKDGQRITAGFGIYHGFWARDFGYTCRALDTLGLHNLSEDCLNYAPKTQTADGYFGETMHGFGSEWDQNGLMIYAITFHYRLTKDKKWLSKLYPNILKGVKFLASVREITKKDGKDSLHYGLLTAGWSAEHFGWGNNYTYWDNFWGIKAFKEALFASRELGRNDDSKWIELELKDFTNCTINSIDRVMKKNNFDFIPISPYRKLDSAIVGFLGGLWPCKVLKRDDKRIIGTIRKLYDNFMIDGGLFHNVMWLSYAPCLTAQAGNNAALAGFRKEAIKSLKWLIKFSTPTNTWCEGIHPNTKSGSEGDSSSDFTIDGFIFMLRNMLIYEDYENEDNKKLIIANCIPSDWVIEGNFLEIKDAPTLYGKINLSFNLNTYERRFIIKIDQKENGPEGGYIIRIKEILDGRKVKSIFIDGMKFNKKVVDEIDIKNGVKEIKIFY